MSRLFESQLMAERYVKNRPQCPVEISDVVIGFAKEVNGIEPGSKYHGNSMLDAGCGSGQGIADFVPYFDSITGFDVSKAQLEAAGKINRFPNVHYVEAPGEAMPAEDNSIDLITCGNAVHWMDISKFVEECNRVLKPGGCAAVYSGWPTGIVFNVKGASEGQQTLINDSSYEIISQFYNCFSVGQAPITMVMNRYRGVYEKIGNEGKRRVDFTKERTSTLKSYRDMCETLGTYVSYKKTLVQEGREEYDPLSVAIEKLKELWKVSDQDEDEIRFTMRVHYFILMFPKSSANNVIRK